MCGGVEIIVDDYDIVLRVGGELQNSEFCGDAEWWRSHSGLHAATVTFKHKNIIDHWSSILLIATRQ
jgi:hypothetical protein